MQAVIGILQCDAVNVQSGIAISPEVPNDEREFGGERRI
jgi:hypothetical protein